jgi:hypothetical protein
MTANVLGIGEGRALKNVSSAFAQMYNSIPNVEFSTVSPAFANTML